jgi:hypothetical protein
LDRLHGPPKTIRVGRDPEFRRADRLSVVNDRHLMNVVEVDGFFDRRAVRQHKRKEDKPGE